MDFRQLSIAEVVAAGGLDAFPAPAALTIPHPSPTTPSESAPNAEETRNAPHADARRAD